MTTKTTTRAAANTSFFSIAATALAGLILLSTAGFLQASVIHDSAHDTRHALSFPCH